MVSPYCTLLLFRKENFKFSEVALVSVHCNCLIGHIIIVWGYRSRYTANTTVGIYFLIKNVNKITEAEIFFVGYLAALRPTLGHWQGSSLTHPIFITTVIKVRSEGHREPRSEVRFQSLAKCISGIRARNLPIQSVTCYPTPQKWTRNNYRLAKVFSSKYRSFSLTLNTFQTLSQCYSVLLKRYKHERVLGLEIEKNVL